jgi:hypothetical protein
MYDRPGDGRRRCDPPPGRRGGQRHPRRVRPREAAVDRAVASPRPDSPDPWSGAPNGNGSAPRAWRGPAPGSAQWAYQVGPPSSSAPRDRVRSTDPPGQPSTSPASGRRRVSVTPARWSNRACGRTHRGHARPGPQNSSLASRPRRVHEKNGLRTPNRACGRCRVTGRSGSPDPVWPPAPTSRAGPGAQDGPGVRIGWTSVAPAQGRAPRPDRQRTGWADRSPMAIVSW